MQQFLQKAQWKTTENTKNSILTTSLMPRRTKTRISQQKVTITDHLFDYELFKNCGWTLKYLIIFEENVFLDNSSAFWRPAVFETFSKDFASLAQISNNDFFERKRAEKWPQVPEIGKLLVNLSGIYNFLFLCCV